MPESPASNRYGANATQTSIIEEKMDFCFSGASGPQAAGSGYFFALNHTISISINLE